MKSRIELGRFSLRQQVLMSRRCIEANCTTSTHVYEACSTANEFAGQPKIFSMSALPPMLNNLRAVSQPAHAV